jgi:5-methylcytosine-specific restriction endonuclease McrA
MAWDRGRPSPRNVSRPPDWLARRKQVKARDQGRCYLCGQYGADQVDHVVAVSEGGSHELGNLAEAHTACAATKTAQEGARARHRFTQKRPGEKHPGAM